MRNLEELSIISFVSAFGFYLAPKMPGPCTSKQELHMELWLHPLVMLSFLHSSLSLSLALSLSLSWCYVVYAGEPGVYQHGAGGGGTDVCAYAQLLCSCQGFKLSSSGLSSKPCAYWAITQPLDSYLFELLWCWRLGLSMYTLQRARPPALLIY